MPTILIVDDSNFSRRAMRAILEPAGYTVHEASNGLTAIEQYAVQKPDLVLLDLTMKDMHGLEVLRKIQSMDPMARVVIATADIQSEVKAESIVAGAAAFVGKPFDPNIILETVKSLLENKPPCNSHQNKGIL